MAINIRTKNWGFKVKIHYLGFNDIVRRKLQTVVFSNLQPAFWNISLTWFATPWLERCNGSRTKVQTDKGQTESESRTFVRTKVRVDEEIKCV